MSIHREQHITYQARCDDCGMMGPTKRTPEQAIESVTVPNAKRGGFTGGWNVVGVVDIEMQLPRSSSTTPKLRCRACAKAEKSHEVRP